MFGSSFVCEALQATVLSGKVGQQILALNLAKPTDRFHSCFPPPQEVCSVGVRVSSYHRQGKERYTGERRARWPLENEAKITSKGQITVPLAIRRALGVRPGDRLLFESDENGVRVRPLRTESPFAKYRGIGNPGIGSGRAAIKRWMRQMRGK